MGRVEARTCACVYQVYMCVRGRAKPYCPRMESQSTMPKTEISRNSHANMLYRVMNPSIRWNHLNNSKCLSMKEGCWWMLFALINFAERVIFFLNVYLFLRKRERERVSGEGQRERETQNLKQAPGSDLRAQSPTQGSNSWTVRSWPEPESDT